MRSSAPNAMRLAARCGYKWCSPHTSWRLWTFNTLTTENFRTFDNTHATRRTFLSTSTPTNHRYTRTMSTDQKTAGPEGNALFTRSHLFDLTGKVALVTGGGTGIGLMATQALAANGARVYITSRNKEKIENAASTYGGDAVAGEIIPLVADVTSKADIDRLTKEIESREECLDVLVNNAGVSSSSIEVESEGAADMKASLFDGGAADFDDWTDTYRTNVAAVFYVAASFLPLLQASTEKRRGWSGTVINISSISGMIKKSQHHFSYNASKAATIHVNRMLAEEVASNGIKVRINSIAPGVFPSEMTTKESADEQQKSAIPKEKYADKVPAGRPGKDEDMAATVLYFACNQYLNGQTLAVDGGYTLAAGL
ncbi:Putative short-chain dehydrogenase/reductase SDR, NAD(P)-binding domain superfamily [Colletotrichum destructivum]|nr:Putative short-chain dehydrogenase/reductase SDR, NAD(P)-binding domain superfamily [Colletotrichum destructivum]